MPRIIPLYEAHAAEWEAEFQHVRRDFADRMQCRRGCSMCCGQMFSISALEAAVIASAVARLPDDERDQLRRRAHAYAAEAVALGLGDTAGGEASLVPRTGTRLPCPALRDDACSIYQARPIICRKWGIPVFDPAKPQTLLACELNFRAGEAIDAAGLVERQSTLLERWVLVKDAAARDLPPSARTCTVAEAILATDLVTDDE